MKVTWLGQGGFLFEAGAARLAVDPYLSDALAHKGLERLVPAPMTPAQLAPTGTCWVVGTAACDSGVTPIVTVSTVATSSLGDATSDSKYTWDSASYAAAACQTAYVVSQLQVTTTACVGSWGSCDLSYSYDET